MAARTAPKPARKDEYHGSTETRIPRRCLRSKLRQPQLRLRIHTPPAGPHGGVNMCYGQPLGHAAYGAYPQVQALQNFMPSGMGVPPPPPSYLPMPAPQAVTPGWMQGMPQYASNPNPSGGVQPTDTSHLSGGVQRAQFMINGTGYAPSAGVPTDGVQVNGAWFSPIQDGSP